MSNLLRRTAVTLAGGLTLLGPNGCAGMGPMLGDVLAGDGIYGQQRTLSGQVRRIDDRRQTIELESGWGRTERVRYDGRTQVTYRQRRYRVRDLERGDVVRIRTDADRRGDIYATQIQVQQSVSERRDDDRRESTRLQRFDGRVGQINTRDGWFELVQDRGSSLIVSLSDEADRQSRDRLRKLRRGQRIRVEAFTSGGSRLRLNRFL